MLSGCWSRVERAEILFQTEPPGATCFLSRQGQPLAVAEPTPAMAVVDRTPDEIAVTCRRHGFAEVSTVLPPREVGTYGGYVFTGRPPLDYDRDIHLEMRPLPPGAPR